MFWKMKCKKAAKFLGSYSWQHSQKQRCDVKLVVETVSEILGIPVSFSITPQETSCRIMEMILDYEYRQSEKVLLPDWEKKNPERWLKCIEKDYGKFYEAVYKYKSAEQFWRVQMVEKLSVSRGETKNPFDFQRFFECLEGYLQCSDSVKKAEMQAFVEKSLSAVWGVYLEKQRNI